MSDKAVSNMVAVALSAVWGAMDLPRKPQRIKDPARDAERILAAEQKRARKAARRAARNKA